MPNRRRVLLSFAALAAARPVPAVLAQALETVKIAKLTGVSDAPFYIGDAKGFYREAGVNVEFTTFPQSNQTVPALAQGRLDGMGASVTAAIWNSVAQGLPLKIVADRGLDFAPYAGLSLCVRADLTKSGRVKGLKDLAGTTFAEPGRGSSNLPIVVRFLQLGGLKYDDVKHVFLPFPEQIAAFKNGSIDAAVLIEPFATGSIREGFCTRLAFDTDAYPRHQISTLMYNGDFMQKRPEAAHRFMVGYVRSLRYYHDALKNGHLAGPTAADVIGIIQDNIHLPDPSIYREMYASGDTTDGTVDVPSLEFDYEVYRAQGLIDKPVDVRKAIDVSVALAAGKQLGPYVAAR